MADADKDPFLLALGERVRLLRSRRGLTRKSVSAASGVSARHLANLEYGTGNASILVLQQVANALDCSLAELVGDMTTRSPEWLLLRELLRDRSDAELRRARTALTSLFGEAGAHLRSFSVIPLRDTETFGLLALASEDAQRFYPEVGTLYLTRLGELVGAAIKRYAA